MNPIEALMETATPLQRKLLEGCNWVPETGCWEWVGNKSGTIKASPTVRSKSVRALLFEEFVGPLSGTDRATPSCGNFKCSNPTHMSPKVTMPPGYWTKERCAEEALNYDSITCFARKSTSAYNSAIGNDWLEEICSHMKRKLKRPGYWTKERCAEEALKYSTVTDFQKNCKSGYNKVMENGWFDEICSNLVYTHVRVGWDKNKCAEEALKYLTKIEFRKGSPSAYSISVRERWMDEICQHMHRPVKWNYESCREVAKMYDKRSDFKNENGGAYTVSRKNGWLDEFFPK